MTQSTVSKKWNAAIYRWTYASKLKLCNEI